jgi:ATP-dependent RNA helicase RhlE
MAPEIAELAAGLLRNPVRVEVAPPATTVGTIEQSVILVGRNDKRAKMNELLKDPALSKVIVFSRTKHGADRIAKNLAMDGHSVAAIHGDKRQNARQAALKGFTDGKVRLLVATDIAARGIDVPNISHVINFELPDAADNYVHRIGRTGRNGASGIAITLCSEGEFEQLRDVEKLIRRSLPKTGYVNGIEKLDAPAPRQSNGRRPGTGQTPRNGQPRTPRQAEAPRHPGDAQRTRPAQPQTPSRSPADVQRPGNAVPGGARPQAKAWWEKDTGSAAPKADKPKQRWSGKPRGDKPGGQRRERVAG